MRSNEARTEAGLGADVAHADWLNAPSSRRVSRDFRHVDFAAPNTATIPTTIDITLIVPRYCLAGLQEIHLEH
jgi:hypothetical protein